MPFVVAEPGGVVFALLCRAKNHAPPVFGMGSVSGRDGDLADIRAVSCGTFWGSGWLIFVASFCPLILLLDIASIV